MKSLKMGLGFAAVLAFSTMTMAAQTSNPVKDDLFAGTEIFAKGASDVTEITMDPDTLGMVNGRDSRRAHNTVLNVVRTYSYDKPGMYKIEDVEAFRNKLNTGDWHCSIHTRSLKTGESTDVCNKQRSDGLTESAIITVEPKELTFIHTIRKKSEGESEMGDMPIMMMDGMPALAMLDADTAMLTARLKALNGTGTHIMPDTFLLHVPDGNGATQGLEPKFKIEKDKRKTFFFLKTPKDGATPALAPPAPEPSSPTPQPAPQAPPQ